MKPQKNQNDERERESMRMDQYMKFILMGGVRCLGNHAGEGVSGDGIACKATPPSMYLLANKAAGATLGYAIRKVLCNTIAFDLFAPFIHCMFPLY